MHSRFKHANLPTIAHALVMPGKLAPYLFLLRQVAELQQHLAAVKRERDEARAAADRVEAELQEEKARFRRWGRQGRQGRRESVCVICRGGLGEVCLWLTWGGMSVASRWHFGQACLASPCCLPKAPLLHAAVVVLCGCRDRAGFEDHEIEQNRIIDNLKKDLNEQREAARKAQV